MQPDVQFEEESIRPVRYASMQSQGGRDGYDSPVVSFLVKNKIIRSERQAGVLIAILALLILIAVFFFIHQALAEPQIIELKTY